MLKVKSEERTPRHEQTPTMFPFLSHSDGIVSLSCFDFICVANIQHAVATLPRRNSAQLIP
jgi:hypothetical protein